MKEAIDTQVNIFATLFEMIADLQKRIEVIENKTN